MIKFRKMNSTLAAAALCVASVGWTAAQAQEASTDQPQTQPPSATTPAAIQPQVISKCSQLIGVRVENPQRQQLGKITDVVVSFDSERVSYCVLGIKHGIFAKARYLAVPLAALQPSDDGSHLVLNADRANLAKAKGFARNEWPSAIVPAWGAQPGAPEQLPPVEVFAPAVRPARAVGYPRTPEPIWGPYSPYQSASDNIDALRFELMFGYRATPH